MSAPARDVRNPFDSLIAINILVSWRASGGRPDPQDDIPPWQGQNGLNAAIRREGRSFALIAREKVI